MNDVENNGIELRKCEKPTNTKPFPPTFIRPVFLEEIQNKLNCYETGL